MRCLCQHHLSGLWPQTFFYLTILVVLSAHCFQNLSFHHMITIFFTASGHVSFKFIFLLFWRNNCLISWPLHFRVLQLYSDRASWSSASLPTYFPHLVYFHELSTPPSCCVPSVFPDSHTLFIANKGSTSMSLISKNNANDGFFLPAAFSYLRPAFCTYHLELGLKHGMSIF